MESYKREFIEFLEGAGVLKFGDFTAKSGRKIPYFINAGDIKTGDQICKLGEFYAKAYFEKIKNTDIRSVVKNKITTNTPYDKVWEHIIDFFAENSIPIGVISKESGLITANGVSFDENQVSFEDKNGEINNQYAYLPEYNLPQH